MYMARKRQNVLVEVEELETQILNSIDAEGIAASWLGARVIAKGAEGLWQ